MADDEIIYSDRIIALSQHLEVEPDELNETSYNEQIIEYGNQEYLVVDDSEADDAWDEDLENFIDDCVLYEIPEQYRKYFDHEAFCRIDGRAHSLSGYGGGGEDCETVDGTEYFIYRQN